MTDIWSLAFEALRAYNALRALERHGALRFDELAAYENRLGRPLRLDDVKAFLERTGVELERTETLIRAMQER